MKKDDITLALNAYKAKRRQDEIDAYGKIISLKTVIQKDKKKYNRKKKHKKNDGDQENE